MSNAATQIFFSVPVVTAGVCVEGGVAPGTVPERWAAPRNRRGVTTEERIYSSNDWDETPTYAYNSATNNPTPDDRVRVDGAYSGPLDLAAGDNLQCNCRAEVTPEHAAKVVVPLPTQPLRFANETLTGEMCVLTVTGRFVAAF